MIRSEQHGRVQVLTLDRHEQRNALNPAIVQGLAKGADEAEANGSRAIVITGAGTAFCAGADLDTVADGPNRQAMYDVFSRMTTIGIPIIAAINGPCIGAGVQLAIACDLRVAAPAARFALPTAKLGLAVDQWSIRRLVSVAGGGLTRSLLLGLETVSVERAHTLGLVDRLGTFEDALEWATELAEGAPLTMLYNKLALNAAEDIEATDPIAEEAHTRVWNSDDAKEAFMARLEKRKPDFQGR